MKTYSTITLKVGEVFTDKKAKELKEYLEAKDDEIKEFEKRRIKEAIKLFTTFRKEAEIIDNLFFYQEMDNQLKHLKNKIKKYKEL